MVVSGKRGLLSLFLSTPPHTSRHANPSLPPHSHSGTFKLTLDFTEEYPNRPPTVKFVTPLFHPNVYADGAICLDILQNAWTPIYDVAAVLTSIQSLLCDPNPASPANAEAARLYADDRREYNRRVRACVDASILEEAAEGEDEEEEEECGAGDAGEAAAGGEADALAADAGA